MTSDAARRPYHHPNLRKQLIESAFVLVHERGVTDLTLREVARHAGVSHNAPYRHFADKAALLQAMAVEGFAALEQSLRAASVAAPGAAMEKTRVIGVAYVRFALQFPEVFRLMFWPRLRQPGLPEQLAQATPPPDGDEPLDGEMEAAEAAYAVLRETIRAGQDEGAFAPGDVDDLALAAWALVHGLAVLLLEGHLTLSPDEVAVVAQQTLGTLIDGLKAR